MYDRIRRQLPGKVLLPIPLALLLSALLLLIGQTGASSAASLTAVAAQRCFTEVDVPFVDVSDGSVAWADYDGDEDMDLLIAGRSSLDESVTRLYRNDGGSFTEINAGLMNLQSTSAAWADFDGDGDPDLLLTGLDSDYDRQSKLYRNDNGDFVDVETPFVKVSNGAAAWADYDGDDDLDVVITGSTDGGSRVSTLYRNDNGTFVESGADLIGVDFSSVAWADYDGDSDPDLLLMGQSVDGLGQGYDSAGTTRLYRNDEGVLVDSASGLTNLEAGSAAWADYDGDEDKDLILMGVSYNSFSPTTNQITYLTETLLYRNDNGTFTQESIDLTDLGDGDVSWADYDGDGNLDLFIMGTRGGIKDAASLDPFAQVSILYQNNGGSASDFSPLFDPVIALRGGSAAWADYDRDGDPDLLVTGAIGASHTPWTLLYRNGPCAGDNEFDVADGDVDGLIAAIHAANQIGTSDPTRSIAAPAVINLATDGSYTLFSVNNTDNGPSGLPSITGNVIINGNGATIARSSAAGTPEFRILRAQSGSALTLRDLTITNGVVTTGTINEQFGGGINSFGALTLESTRILSNTAGVGGGGLMLGAGPVVISDTLIAGNRIVGDTEGGGGGLQAQAGLVELSNVTIENNSAPDGGGLVTVVDNSEPLHLTINRSTIRNNRATGSANPPEGTGGGIRLSLALTNNAGSSTVVTVNDTLISNNTAINGGGIGVGLLQPGSAHLIQLTLNRSAVVNNLAQGAGMQEGNGGGILNVNAALHLVNSTISGNTANGNPQVQFSGVGGGIANGRTGLPTTVAMTNTSIISNTALAGGGVLNALAAGTTPPVVSFANSLIGGNTALGGAPFGPSCLNQGGTLTSLGHNLDQNNSCGFTAEGDQTNVNPLVGPLADNGGPTPTHALMDNSPAIDAADGALCPTTDQRGVARPQGQGCDIGAYEATNVQLRVFLPMTQK